MASRAHGERSVSSGRPRRAGGVLRRPPARRNAGGLAAAGLLTLNVAEVWFSRYPNTELAMQAVLFAALLASARAHVDCDAFFAPVSGAFLGLLLFLRFDAVLGIAGVLAALALGVVAGRARTYVSFFVSLIGVAAFAAWTLLFPMKACTNLPIVFLSNFAWWQYALIALGTTGGIVALVAGGRRPALAAAVANGAPLVLAVAVLVAAIYALFLREPIGALAMRDAVALRTFANFYLTVPGLLAALVGFALLARSSFWRAPEIFTTVALFSFFFFYKIRIASDHFWMARRFLPVILPGAALCRRGGAQRRPRPMGVDSPGPRRDRRDVSGLAGDVQSRAAQPVMGHVEYAGIIPRLETLASRIGDRDLLIVESRNASDTHLLGLPLAYIYAKNVLLLSSPKPDKTTFAGFLDWARTRYERVLFIGGGGTDSTVACLERTAR